MKNETHGIRWDKVFGLLSLIAILILAVMIMVDFKPITTSTQESSTEENAASQTEETAKETTGAKVTVAIDAGHGGSDKGSTVSGKNEKDQTLEMALKVQKELQAQNVNVVMTRTTDTYVSDEERVRICNDANAVAIVSIHRNVYEGTENVYGSEAWIHTSAPSDSEALAKGILAQLKTDVDEDSRGVKYGMIQDFTSNYYINAKSKCASCILELGYMSSSYDTPLVTTKSDATAKSIADGIVKYLKTQGYLNE